MNLKRIFLYFLRKCYFLPDNIYLKIKFGILLKYKLNLKNPVTFNEKLQWLKLYDRKELYSKLVDKYEVKEYLKKIIGDKYIIPTIAVYDQFNDIDFEQLPNQFVIKCTHDSGGLVIVKDKKQLDINKARRKINKCLKRNFFYNSREWPYKNIKPRIIIEKFMIDDCRKNELLDYKVMCFNGKPEIIFVCSERYSSSGLKVTFFDSDWNKLPFERHYPSSKKEIKKPAKLDKMLELSSMLSKNIPFVRMDWYEINGEIYFGEYTFFPGGGFEEFSSYEWDKKLGDMIDLSGSDLK